MLEAAPDRRYRRDVSTSNGVEDRLHGKRPDAARRLGRLSARPQSAQRRWIPHQTAGTGARAVTARATLADRRPQAPGASASATFPGQGKIRPGQRCVDGADTLAHGTRNPLATQDLDPGRRRPVVHLLCTVAAWAGLVRAGPGEGGLGRFPRGSVAHICTLDDQERNRNFKITDTQRIVPRPMRGSPRVLQGLNPTIHGRPSESCPLSPLCGRKSSPPCH